MGRVVVQLKLTNYLDFKLRHLKRLRRPPRALDVEALVDTGATRLYLKPSVIRSLGLDKTGEVDSQTTNRLRRRSTYDPVHLELMGRDGNFDVVEVDENVPNLLGQIPLEHLDLVVDTKGRKLIPNPAHGDKLMTEEYHASDSGTCDPS
ncbi:MAG: retropepsin-like domain-containing protein [Verrucomicrobia bacterium]|nr:retropepsin-like domain-containing protein [Verrucomicrobiota bacterium]